MKSRDRQSRYGDSLRAAHMVLSRFSFHNNSGALTVALPKANLDINGGVAALYPWECAGGRPGPHSDAPAQIARMSC